MNSYLVSKRLLASTLALIVTLANPLYLASWEVVAPVYAQAEEATESAQLPIELGSEESTPSTDSASSGQGPTASSAVELEIPIASESAEASPSPSPIPSPSPSPSDSQKVEEKPGEVLGLSTINPLLINLTKPFVGEYVITQKFGERVENSWVSLMQKLFGVEAHDGVDYAMPEGTPILAADQGEVVRAGQGMYGVMVELRHSWGNSFYGHLSEVTVTVGQKVKRGEIIGKSGNTGVSTGPHLHFGIRPRSANFGNGYWGMIDPMPYFGQAKELESGKQLRQQDLIELAKTTYRGGEKVIAFMATNESELQFSLVDPKGVEQEIEAELVSAGTGENAIITVPSPQWPGEYVLGVRDAEGNWDEERFAWGVLALNPNKSRYLPGDTASLSMAVLDQAGEMVCDAELTLTVISPSGQLTTLSTLAETIQVNLSTCTTKLPTLEPDYFATFELLELGQYQMELVAKTQAGSYTITDSIVVEPTSAYSIERLAPTRIYPENILPMALVIQPQVDYQGLVTEQIPADFRVVPPSDGDLARFLGLPEDTPIQAGTTAPPSIGAESITWEVDWRAGQTYLLHYFFDAPDDSPELYFLGPLRLTQSSATVFAEERFWQLAIDSVSTAEIAPSFQRKTWHDGTRYWRSYLDTTDNQIEFEYSTDGSSWTEDASARIAVDTSDYSVYADSSNAYVAYTTSAVANQDNLLTEDLVGYWKMNESSWNGTTDEVVDSSGNSLHGTRSGNATTTSSGKFNNAGTFDGTGDYVVADIPSNLSTSGDSSGSISFWIKPDWASSVTTTTVAFVGAGTGYSNFFGLYFQGSDYYSGGDVGDLAFATPQANVIVDSAAYSWSAGEWVHIALLWDDTATSDSMRIFINGQEPANTDTTPASLDISAMNLGSNFCLADDCSGVAKFDGLIDDSRVYDRVLSEDEIATLANPGYDIEVRKAASYPGTGFSWGSATVVYNGSSSSDYYQYPTIAYDSNSKVWVNATYYGGTEDTLNLAINDNANDGYEWESGSTWEPNGYSNGGEIWLGAYSSADENGGFRFTNLTIPQGATITEATLKLRGNDGTGTPNLKVYADDADNPGAWSSSQRPSTITATTAQVDWDISSWSTSGYNTAPDISSVIQEIVDRPGWNSGNAIRLAVANDGTTGNDEVSARDYYTFSSTPATLDITYTSASYNIVAVQATTANDITAWGTASNLNSSANSNQYGVIVPRTSGSVYSVWMDGTAIEGKNYNGTSWDGSPTSIATGSSGITNNLAALADSAGQIYLTYINGSGQTVYQEFTSSWQTAFTLDSAAGNTHPTISYDTVEDKLYALWLRDNDIYYRAGSPLADQAALNFDGSADYALIPHDASLDVATDLTIEFWFKLDTTINSGTTFPKGLISKAYSTTDAENDWVFFWETGNAGRLRFGSYGDNIQTTTSTWTADTWYHIAVTVDSSNNAYIYVNGVQDNYNSDTSIAGNGINGTQNSPINLGRSRVSAGDQYFDGVIDEFRMYDTVRSGSAILADLSTPLAGDETNLIGYWNLNENTGQTIADLTSNSNDGTLGATSGASTDDPAWTTTTPLTTEDVWDSAATSWITTGTNTYLTSNYSGGGKIFAQWLDGTTLTWDELELGASTISISGTANGNEGATVKYAVNSTAGSETTTIASSAWSITGVTVPSANDIITVWIDNVSDSNEATAVTKYGSGSISGMVLDTNALSLGSNQNTSLTLTNLNSYDCSQDEDIMHQAASSHLKVEGDACAGSTTNSYSAEELEMLSGNTLILDGTETLTTYDLTITGTLTSSGNATYNIAHNWAKTGTFTSSTSTVNLTGADSSTQTMSGSTSFYNLSISTSANSAGRTLTFTSGTTQTVTGTWTVTGYSGKVITLQGSTTSAWTINPTAASVTYASIAYSTNSGISFCATYSTDSGNNTGWNITDSDTCPAIAEIAPSFQRKTWHDGTRYWRSYLDTTDNRIEFEYSTDGTSWTEDTSARIAVDTSDYSVYADASNAYITYTNGYDIEVRKAASYPGIGFSWGTATVVYNGASSSDYYQYPTLAYDSNSKVWVSATQRGGSEDTLNLAINSDTNDGYEFELDSSWHQGGYNNGGEIWLGSYDGNDENGGFRFTNLTIPQGATITEATLKLRGNDGTGTPNLKIYADDADNPGAWSSSQRPSTITATTAQVDWDISSWSTSGYNTAPDISSVIQEIVDRPGWNSGNAIRLAVVNDGTSGTSEISARDYYIYPSTSTTLDITYTDVSYNTVAVQASSANDITSWETAATLNTSTNSNQYGVIVPRASGSVYSIWIDGTAIEGKNYNGTSWDGSPTSIDTGVTGLTKTLSSVADSSGNVYLTYISDEATDQVSASTYNGTSWSTPVLVADAASDSDAYPSLTLDTTNADLYAFWIDTSNNYIYYSSCAISTGCDSASEWEAETSWQTTGTNTYFTSNYSGAGLIFGQWLDGTTIGWDKVSVAAANNTPVVSSVAVNGGNLISLTEGNTTEVSWTSTVTDADGYAQISSVTGVLYRSGVTNAEACTPDNANCYADASCSLSSCSGSSCTATCTVEMLFFAEPTDASSPYVAEYWRGYMEATDTEAAAGEEWSSAGSPDLASLAAMDLTGSIAYDLLVPGDDTGASNETMTVTNTGNTVLDLEVSGDDFCTDYPTCSGATIAVGYQEYATSGFTYGAGTVLTSIASLLQFDLAKSSTNPANSTGNLYWGMGVPSPQADGSYQGANTITAVDGD